MKVKSIAALWACIKRQLVLKTPILVFLSGRFTQVLLYLFKGNVSCYLVEKYKFSPDCKVVAFTVDGLQSLVGVGATNTETELIVSIVTS